MGSRAKWQKYQLIFLFLCLILGQNRLTSSAFAQSSATTCKSPSPGKYIILVRTATGEAQLQVRRNLPQDALNTEVCTYQGETVTRVGEFANLEDAQKWANYFNNTVKLSAVVVSPPQTSAATTNPTPNSNIPVYKPQALGNGYAVLVDYFNQPEIAGQTRQVLGKDVGLAAYLARPYLLAVYTANEKDAQATLQRLTEKGFWAIVVDSRLVTVLTPTVKY